MVRIILQAHQSLKSGLPALDREVIHGMLMKLVIQAQESWKSLVPRYDQMLGRMESREEAYQRVERKDKDRLKSVTKRARKDQKYKERLSIIDIRLSELDGDSDADQIGRWKGLKYLVEQLDIDGQSSDDDATIPIRGAYVRGFRSSLPHWRRRKIRQLLTEVDKVGDILRVAKSVGSPRKPRFEGFEIHESKVKAGLPHCFYRPIFLEGLNVIKRQDLNIARTEFTLLDSDTEIDDDMGN
ncbi:hypothetical protein VKT23_015138 [Stygiomarasmius scandens]|uniref:Uncharacterized protein n=1 Tax=Marasmiellus scandens TaxID=2682957 RepID=A0ABR1IYQ3_9AGAR